MKTTIHILFVYIIIITCPTFITGQNQVTETERQSDWNQQIITFLTFQKEDAEQAMNLYISLFDNSRIINIQRWGKEGPGKEGTIMQATFELSGQKFMCSDSPPVHNWDFTPAVSNFVECKNEEELERLFAKLSEGGAVAMPLDNYGFSQKFGWVVDRFGVSWQLNLQ
jgi:predicted 3-demethylubiquinone-9 3-methyltransferase (glyoxalase superfamily)